MKVFELMNQLAEMPAGADVKFSRLTSVKELIEGTNISGPDEEPYYTVISIAAFCFGFVLGYRREDKKIKKSLKERAKK